MPFSSRALFSFIFFLLTLQTKVSAQEERKYVRGRGEMTQKVEASIPGTTRRTASEQHPTEPPTRRVIVKYKKGHKKGCVDAMAGASHNRAAGEPEIEVDHDFDELDTFVITAKEDEIQELEKSPEIELIEEDAARSLLSVRGSDIDPSRFLTENFRKLVESIPYGVEMVEAPELWEQGATGQGVKVCVIDSGIERTHSDFVTSRLTGSGTGDVIWSEDGCGHGTHVAGTIAAKDDNKGVIGVAPDAEIFSVRVFEDDCGLSFSSEIYSAAQTCKANGANIISMSLGGPESVTFERDVFDNLFNDGILLVAAAGNDGDSSLSYPASYSSVMSVAAVDKNKEHAPFSQYNSQVDIAAPGVDVLSTFPVGGCEICGIEVSGYGQIDGTSMATPHVSAVAALLLSAVPGTSAAELRQALEASAEDRGISGRDNYYGYGIVRANAAYQYLTSGSAPPAPPGPPGGDSCTDISGWYDSWGSTFDCDWYAQEDHCTTFGDDYENFGATASEACCACGGGETDNTGPTPTPPTSTPPPSGSDSMECNDIPGWYDSDGADYDCDWYAEETRCEDHGDDYANFGKTANEACCACGGGVTEETEPPPSDGACNDNPAGWYDSWGPLFDCDWYSEFGNCEMFGDSFSNFGKTAQEACCACGGGSTSTTQLASHPESHLHPKSNAHSESHCLDSPGWTDSAGPEFNCDWYALENHCEVYGNDFESHGITAKQACCACGGGLNETH